MQKEILLEMVNQNLKTCSYALDRVTEENKDLRLNEQTASIGFILRHIGETINMFGLFFGITYRDSKHNNRANRQRKGLRYQSKQSFNRHGIWNAKKTGRRNTRFELA